MQNLSGGGGKNNNKIEGVKLLQVNNLQLDNLSENSSFNSKKNRDKSSDDNNNTIPKSFCEFAKMKRTNSCKSDGSEYFNIKLNEPQPDVNVFNIHSGTKLHRYNSILENSVPYNELVDFKTIKNVKPDDVQFQTFSRKQTIDEDDIDVLIKTYEDQNQ